MDKMKIVKTHTHIMGRELLFNQVYGAYPVTPEMVQEMGKMGMVPPQNNKLVYVLECNHLIQRYKSFAIMIWREDLKAWYHTYSFHFPQLQHHLRSCLPKDLGEPQRWRHNLSVQAEDARIERYCNKYMLKPKESKYKGQYGYNVGKGRITEYDCKSGYSQGFTPLAME